MRLNTYIAGSVLPTVIVVSVLMLLGMLGLLALWEQQTLSFARACRLRQARSDVESAYTLYRLHPEFFNNREQYRLYDTLPQSCVRIGVRSWGLYEAVSVASADSLVRSCRLFGVRPDAAKTLYYADSRTALNLAGKTVLQGELRLPQNGLAYGRVGADFYRGDEVPQPKIGRSDAGMPLPDAAATEQIVRGFAGGADVPVTGVPDSLHRSFGDSTLLLRVTNARIGMCSLSGNIVLYADELYIDSTCRMRYLLIFARKITVGSGARISAQLFARDTVAVEPRAALEYPSGIYARHYAEIGEQARVNGYVIVRDTVSRKKVTANYRQSRTARLRGLLWVDGVAQVQGIVAGRAFLRQAAYFSPQGYYKDMLYDAALLENPVTAQPLWLSESPQRKEAVCAD